MKNVYVVSFSTDEGCDYSDLDAVFSTMKKAKKYVHEQIDRLKGTNTKINYDEPVYYEIQFINTYTLKDGEKVFEEVWGCATEHEIDIECEGGK